MFLKSIYVIVLSALIWAHHSTGDTQTTISIEPDALHWLALNVHHEARGEPYECQVAAAEVVMRRVDSERYPDTVEEVVTQYKQFSWTLFNERPYDFSVITETDLAVAREAMSGYSKTTGEMHYARYEIDNYWTRKMTKTFQCGAHIFYIGE